MPASVPFSQSRLPDCCQPERKFAEHAGDPPNWKVCILHRQVKMAYVRLCRKFMVEKVKNNRLKQ